MNSITIEQVKILVDRALTLKSDQIATEKSSYDDSIRKIQASFTMDHMVLFHYQPGDNKLVITVKLTNRNYFDRVITLPKHFRFFNPYYREWRRLLKDVNKRVLDKAYVKAEKEIEQVSQAINTMFPDIIEKELLK